MTTSEVVVPEEFNKNDSLRVAYHYTEGMKVVTLEDDISKALPHFERVLGIDSLHAATHYQIGGILSETNPDEALLHHILAYSADSMNTEYARGLGNALLQLRFERQPRDIFERLIELEPRNAENYYIVARLSMWLDEYDKAHEIIELSERRIGRNMGIMELKRALYMNENRYGEALRECQISVKMNPYDIEALLDMGHICTHLKNFKDGEEALLQVLKIDPNHRGAHILLAGLYHASVQDEKMLDIIKRLFLLDSADVWDKYRIYNQCIDSRGNDFLRKNIFAINAIWEAFYLKYGFPFNYPPASILYIKHKLHMGEQERALELLYMLCDQESAYSEVYLLAAQIEFHNNNIDNALKVLNKGIKNVGYDSLVSTKALLLLQIGKPLKTAERLIKKGIRKTSYKSTKSALYTTLADIQIEPKKAFPYYAKAVEYDPENCSALNNWAYLSANNGGDLEEALQMSTKVCEIEPSEPNYIDTKAWILFLMGRISEAKTLMRQAISLDTSNESTFLLHYGDILTAEGEYFMAEHYYKRALTAGEDEEVVALRLERVNLLRQK